MKRKVMVFLFFVSSFQVSYSQNQTNFWYFGLLAGLDFSSGSPVVVTNGTTASNEGTAVISDSLGNLLFYTDGVQVWNRNNVQMPNGFGLLGDVTSSGVMIVPNPGNTNLYYIFTQATDVDTAGLNYSVVDMTLQSGDGDVTVKNNFIRNNMTEKVAAVYHCNNHDIWVLTHDAGFNTFIAYLVTNSGVSAPVFSPIGSIHYDWHGIIKFSSDGKRLACSVSRDSLVEVFDFDNETGVVSAPISIPLFHKSWGIEFSPDNSKLYASYYDVAGPGVLLQFDLNAPNVPTSQTTIALTPFDVNHFGLQLARDNKIYVTKEVTPFLAVIDAPNVAGAGCTFIDNAINLDPLGTGTMCMLGLPGFIQSFFHPAFPNIPCSNISSNFFSSDTILCTGQCINFTDASTGAIISRAWTFFGAFPSSSTAINPVNICYPNPGSFNVRLIVSDGTITDTIMKTITVVASPAINAGADATIQTGGSVSLNATGTATNFSWTPATGLSATNISNPVASPSVTTTYTVVGTGSNNCTAQDNITIFVEDIPTPCGDVFIPTAFSPNGAGAEKNELECVVGNCIVNMHFAIYDRLGEKVFETTDQEICWDGKYKGELMNTASFVYYFTATLISGEEISKKGNISLIR